jgi:ATP-binding protein involved in chromosome partitioning
MNPDRPTPEEVWRMLEAVIDPELHSSVVDLGMVRDVAVDEDGLVSVEIALTIASCPLRGQIEGDVESRLRGLPGVTGVEIRTTAMTAPERASLMAKARKQAAERAPETEIPLTTRILAVASGKGGVGKSSVTVNLAAALAARGHTVGVLDADIWGFSVPRMLGIKGRLGGSDGKIHPNLVEVPSVRPGGPAGTLKVVSMGFLVEDEGMALMWRGLVLAKAVEQFLTDVRWGDLEYLLVDMPPGTGDIQMALSRLLPRAELLVVTTPALAAQKVAVRVADMARRSYLKVAGVVENMSAFTCDHGQSYALFGTGGGEALAAEVGAPLLAQIPLEPGVASGGDAGAPLALAEPQSAATFWPTAWPPRSCRRWRWPGVRPGSSPPPTRIWPPSTRPRARPGRRGRARRGPFRSAATLDLVEPAAEPAALVLLADLGQDLRGDGVHDVLRLVEQRRGVLVESLRRGRTGRVGQVAVAPADVGQAGLVGGTVLRTAPGGLGGEVEVALPDGVARRVGAALVELAVGPHSHASMVRADIPAVVPPTRSR